MPTYPTPPPAVTLPTVIGERWSETGIQGGMVLADHDLADVADLTTSPGAMTVLNGDEFAALSIGSGLLTAQPTTDADAASTWPTDNANCYATLPPAPGGALYEFHVAVLDATVGRASAECYVLDDTTTSGYHCRLDAYPAGADGAAVYSRVQGSGTTLRYTVAGVSDATLEAGYWWRIHVRDDMSVRIEFAAGAAAARPDADGWTFCYEGSDGQLTGDNPIRVGFGLRYITGQSTFNFGALRAGNALVSGVA